MRNKAAIILCVCLGCGVVFGRAHSIGTDVPVEKYEAFINALREYGTYPLHV